MGCNRVCKIIGIVGGLAPALSLAIFIVPLTAQTGVHSVPYYDATKEVTISGTVSAVLTKPAPGMTWGCHLLIATLNDTVDASLGRWGLQSTEALSAIGGKQVEVLGVMKNINGKQVFLARTVKADGKLHVIRNARGVPISPQTRERAARKGESL